MPFYIDARSCCDICFESYGSSSGIRRSPSALSCGHIFCDGCLKQLSNNMRSRRICCPVCRQEAVTQYIPDRLIVEPAPPPSPVVQEIAVHEAFHEASQDALGSEWSRLDATEGDFALLERDCLWCHLHGRYSDGNRADYFRLECKQRRSVTHLSCISICVSQRNLCSSL
ncbi:hypothetical protein PENSPDRAFT_94020 [Peniophora sp. CONT]|nr:hypothetical protein PENSPDRAFT_94020 [Peniophora sp. CONT]